jgi:hypothetical protein
MHPERWASSRLLSWIRSLVCLFSLSALEREEEAEDREALKIGSDSEAATDIASDPKLRRPAFLPI